MPKGHSPDSQMTFYGFLDKWLRNQRALGLVLAGAVAAIAALVWFGLVNVQREGGRVVLSFGNRRPSADVDSLPPAIVGTWIGEITDQRGDGLQTFYRHQVTLRIAPGGQVVGDVATRRFDDDSLIGTGEIDGTSANKDGYLRVSYGLVTKTSNAGFGVLLVRVQPNGKEMDGYAIYRRTNPNTGDFGMGRVHLKR